MVTWVLMSWRQRKPMGIAFAAIGVIGVLLWQSPQIMDGYVSTRDLLVRSLAFGLLPPILWAAALASAFWKKRSLLRRRYWNRWTATLLASSVAWGVLAYFSDFTGILQEVSLGGWIGQKIKGSSDVLGVFRLLGIAALVTAVAFPNHAGKFLNRALLVTKRMAKASGRLAKKCEASSSRETSSKGFPFAMFRRAWTSRREGRVKARITVQDAPTPQITRKAGRPVVRRNTPALRRVDSVEPSLKPQNTPPVQTPALLMMPDSTGEPKGKITREEIERWAPPAISMLTLPPAGSAEPGIDQEKTAHLIETTLGDYGIEVRVSEVKPGPVVTMFGLVPGWVRRSRDVKERTLEGSPVVDERGRSVVRRIEDKARVKVDSIVAREKDLALALAAPSLRIEAPIPGASLVGIEVPNPRPAIVTLRSVMETNAFRVLSSKSKLALGLGMGTGGEVAAADLASMPHLLIAGSTGSGKSVCINSVIASILMHNSPWETRMLLIDPKRVELTPYNGIPHLLAPVVVEVDVAVQMLKGMILEMLRRYKVFEEASARNIEGYNRGRSVEDRMPLVVVAVDELADLMMSARYDIERSIIRLAQLGRATGIHLVVATQRPSVDVVTGLIKANFPSRISFAVASQVDSRTILDSVGAEKLLGRGDMLFQPSDTPKPKRTQGAFISDGEIEELVTYWQKRQGPLPPEISLDIVSSDESSGMHDGDMGDELLQKAWDLATQYNRLSTSLLQRRLRIGYPRAARLMDLLEEEGVVGPGEGGKSREVLVARGGGKQSLGD
jgi:S-DNA-T family DNA segregation ATPase FtsK/SpoIIIE